jgi:HTH-type transcriptional repressor of NAD biosynthesis genes
VKKGMTLGKFAPLHRGHQLVIETGLAEMDEMVVVIYDAPETTTIPLAVRSGWIRSLYPSVKLIEAWDGPTEVGYSPELMRGHEHYLIETLSLSGVTHFYCSEPYGVHVSAALGAIDRRVDDTRDLIPVSATEVRKNPFACHKYVHPTVYRDLITNVVFLGAPCSGKSTLAEYLAKEFNTEWVSEYGREYWEKHQVNRRLNPEQLVEIAETHIEREDLLLQKSNAYLFTDTNAITTATFARYYHGEIDPRLVALADQAGRRYDLIFVCDIDIPYQDTWDRSGEVTRVVFQKQVISDLNQRKVPFIMLSGSLKERVSRVCRVLKHFEKYSNILNIPAVLYDE